MSNIDKNLLNVIVLIPSFEDSQGCCQRDDLVEWFA
jgi:hypothetical protein